jgi:GntR family transcriptional repressor for pyruvate dehydrogenase complex
VIADLVADAIRARILAGDLADGDRLPGQDELIRLYGVSKPAVREALRILEAEGLVTVARGAVGGAVVHGPTTRNVAYTLAMLLESQDVTLQDVGAALRGMEPVCALLAAQRPDRRRHVIPGLRRLHREMKAALPDGPLAVAASRRWHELLVSSCGNQTLTAVIGVLEALWTEHEFSWAEGAARQGRFPPLAVRTRAWEQHGEILDRIADGDLAGVAEAVRRHLAEFQPYPLSDTADPRVAALRVRRHSLPPRGKVEQTETTVRPST